MAGLGILVALRWAATVSAVGPGLLVGATFGAGLVGLTLAAGGRPLRAARPRPSEVVIGLASAGLLIGLAVTTHPAGLPPLRPADALVPWALVTIVVATAEEVVLRGVLFGRLEAWRGPLVAVIVTSVVFALMHVPLYGWHVVPLDLGVGLWLGGLRLASGRVAAPAIAHVVADLATWWI